MALIHIKNPTFSKKDKNTPQKNLWGFKNNKNFTPTQGEKKFLSVLKNIYSDVEHDVFLYEQPKIQQWKGENSLRPDFILFDTKKGLCIFEVKDWTKKGIKNQNLEHTQIHKKNGGSYISKNPFAQREEYEMEVKRMIMSHNLFIQKNKEEINFPFFSYTVFPNMDHLELENTLDFIGPKTKKIITKDYFSILSPEKIFQGYSCKNFSDLYVQCLKTTLFPELKIYKTNKEEIVNDIKALDAEQEKIAKSIPNGHYKVSGVPGSGKTIIIMARAIHLLKENPDWKIKILTYNKQLVLKLEGLKEKMLSALNDKENRMFNLFPENISISTFHAEAMKIAQIEKPKPCPKSWWDNTLAEEAHKKVMPIYNAVLIDEYQDFYENWITLALKTCKKDPITKMENFFIAGDQIQSINNNEKEPIWKNLGVNIVGRTKILKKPYRSKNIKFALNILKNKKGFQEKITEHYESLLDIPDDNKKGITFIGQENIKNFSEIINNLQTKVGENLDEILILIPGKKDKEILKNFLPKEILNKMKFSSSKSSNPFEKKILVSTFHSSKGIEAKHCVLFNIENLYTGKHTKNNAEELLYVGITRSSENSYICGQSNSIIMKNLQLLYNQ